MTEQTQPTDAEILDAADDFRSQYKHGGTTFDEFNALGFARAVLAKWGTPAGAEGDRMADSTRRMIEGMSVSVDVSTGGHDSGHRYFGTVTEVMDCNGDKHGVTLLVQDAEPNFTPQPTQAQAGAVPLPKFLALKFHARRDKKATVTLLFQDHEAADAWVRGIRHKGADHA